MLMLLAQELLSFKALHYPGQCLSKYVLRTIYIKITGLVGEGGYCYYCRFLGPPPRYTVSKTLKVGSQESAGQTRVSMIPIQTKNNALGVGGEEVRERGTLIGSYSEINISRYWLSGRLGIFSLFFILLPTLCWLLMTSEKLTRILKEGVKCLMAYFALY